MRAASRCGREGVKGAVFWRSSRPLTPSRPLRESTWERSSDVFSELRSLFGKRLALLNDPSSHVDSITSDDNRSGSTNHVFGPVKLHDFLFKLSRLGGRGGASNQVLGLVWRHGATRTAPHANRAP